MAEKSASSKSAKKAPVKKAPAKLGRTRKPDNMSLEEWQIALRREYGVAQDFETRNLGKAPIFSDFAVTNPKSRRTYRVTVRGESVGDNFCTCPDFAVNTLGTCKHIEWQLAKLRERRGGAKALTEGFTPAFSEVHVHYGARRRVRFRPGTGCPAALLKAAFSCFGEDGVLREDATDAFESFLEDARDSGHDLRVTDDALTLVANLRDAISRRAMVEKFFEGRDGEKALAALLKTRLYPYQRSGALFAAKAGRCLIADEMGLGKTIQSITAIEILARTSGVSRVLVVCPTALKHQWKQEVEKFTDRSVMVIEGYRHNRARIYNEESFYKVATYDSLYRDLDIVNAWRPDAVIVDEAQRIKNWSTRRAQCVKQIDSDFAIVLTGTPLENRLSDLHSIMEFVDRFRLGPLFRFLDAHQELEEGTTRVAGYRNLDQIKESLAPVLIRRRKSEVRLELPERTDKLFLVNMTKEQRLIHEESREIVVRIVAKWRRYGYISEQDQLRLTKALQRMRMACNSTYLCDKQTDHGPKSDECAIVINELLETPGTKIVIFSQWLGTHEVLIRRLDAGGLPYAFYNGGLDSKQRQNVLERFKTDPDCRILLSTDSGGVGLNLQMASAVINMDQPWNPAVLEQRIGRVHRMGQHRSVQVYNFVTAGSIEHGMLNTLRFKSELAAGVLDGGDSHIALGGEKMKRFMDTVEDLSNTIPEYVPEPLADPVEEPELDEIPEQELVEDAAVSETPAQEPWSALLTAGMALIGQLGQSLQASQAPREKDGAGEEEKRPVAGPLGAFIVPNEKTGAPEMRIPVSDETVQRVGDLLTGLGALFKGIGGKQ